MPISTTAAWLAGLLLALLVLLAGATPLWIQIQFWIREATLALESLGPLAVLLLRSAAIGLAFTALLLGRVALQRGAAVRGVLFSGSLLWGVTVGVLSTAPAGLRWGIATLIALLTALSLMRKATTIPGIQPEISSQRRW